MSIARALALAPGELVVEVARMSYGAWAKKFVIGFICVAGGAFFALPLIRWGWWGQVLCGLLIGGGCTMLIHTYALALGNIYVLTSKRIVSIRRSGIWNKHVDEVLLTKIADTGYGTSGVIQTLCRAGSVKCNTSSGGIVLEWVRHPANMQRFITETIEATHGVPAGAEHDVSPAAVQSPPRRRMPPVPPTPYAVREDVDTVLKNAFRRIP